MTLARYALRPRANVSLERVVARFVWPRARMRGGVAAFGLLGAVTVRGGLGAGSRAVATRRGSLQIRLQASMSAGRGRRAWGSGHCHVGCGISRLPLSWSVIK